MYGLLFDCLEKYIVKEYGPKIWNEILKKADTGIGQSKWVTNERYPDEFFMKLVALSALEVDQTFDSLVEAVGFFFICCYIRKKGYDDYLRCQANSLREWISKVNDLHLQMRIAIDNGDFVFPEIYCIDEKDDEEQLGKYTIVDESGKIMTKQGMLIYHKSKRGSTLAQFTVGVIRGAAITYFNINVNFEQLRTQNVYYSEFTVWRMIETTDPLPVQFAKIHERATAAGTVAATSMLSERPSAVTKVLRCPFSGKVLDSGCQVVPTPGRTSGRGYTPFAGPKTSRIDSKPCGLTGGQLMDVFPYHIGIDSHFVITQIGSKLKEWLPDDVIGQRIDTFFRISEPEECLWQWQKIKLCKDSNFLLELREEEEEDGDKFNPMFNPARHPFFRFGLYGGVFLPNCCSSSLSSASAEKSHTDPSSDVTADAKNAADANTQMMKDEFSTHRETSTGKEENDREAKKETDTDTPYHALFLVQPNIQSLQELVDSGLVLSDFGNFSSQQKLILLAEHLRSETSQSIKSKQQAMLSQQSLEMKRMFVRYVSHEIRTPLNTVMMGLDLLQSLRPPPSPSGGDDDEPLNAVEEELHGLFDIADEIQESCSIALNILNDLLLYEKLEGGLLNLTTKREPALSTIYDAIRTFNIQAKAADVKLEFTFDTKGFLEGELESPAVFLDVDKPKISQVLRNLVSNAIKFSMSSSSSSSSSSSDDNKPPTEKEKGEEKRTDGDDDYKIGDESQDDDAGRGGETANKPKTVIVHASLLTASEIFEEEVSVPTRSRRTSFLCTPSVQKFLRVEVVDEGPGISPENQDKLFGQIIQFDPNTLQGGGGSGLGLYISKGIMDLHGGSIGVYSEGEGKGSVFWIDLPISDGVEVTRQLSSKSSSKKRQTVGFSADMNSSIAPGDIADDWVLSSVNQSTTSAGDAEHARLGQPPSSSSGKDASSSNMETDIPNFLDEWHNHGLAAAAALENQRTTAATAAVNIGGSKEASKKSKKLLMRPTFNYVSPFKRVVATSDGSAGGGVIVGGRRRSSSSRNGFRRPTAELEKAANALKRESEVSSNPVQSEVPDLPEQVAPVRDSSRSKGSTCKSASVSRKVSIVISDRDRDCDHPRSGHNSDAIDITSPPASTAPAVDAMIAVTALAPSRVLSREASLSRRVTPIGSGIASPSFRGSRRALSPVTDTLPSVISKLKILVVDDSLPNRKMTTKSLKMAKIAAEVVIEEANNGLEALEILKRIVVGEEMSFDILLMDFVMPKMDGPTATKAIRDLGYKGIIVGVTGNVLPEDTELFMSQGANAVMSKPLDMKQLKYLLMKTVMAQRGLSVRQFLSSESFLSSSSFKSNNNNNNAGIGTGSTFLSPLSQRKPPTTDFNEAAPVVCASPPNTLTTENEPDPPTRGKQQQFEVRCAFCQQTNEVIVGDDGNVIVSQLVDDDDDTIPNDKTTSWARVGTTRGGPKEGGAHAAQAPHSGGQSHGGSRSVPTSMRYPTVHLGQHLQQQHQQQEQLLLAAAAMEMDNAQFDDANRFATCTDDDSSASAAFFPSFFQRFRVARNPQNNPMVHPESSESSAKSSRRNSGFWLANLLTGESNNNNKVGQDSNSAHGSSQFPLIMASNSYHRGSGGSAATGMQVISLSRPTSVPFKMDQLPEAESPAPLQHQLQYQLQQPPSYEPQMIGKGSAHGTRTPIPAAAAPGSSSLSSNPHPYPNPSPTPQRRKWFAMFG